MLLEQFHELGGMLGSRMVAQPFGRKRQPRHHIGAGGDHTLDGYLMGLEGNPAACIGDHRYVPTVAEGVDHRHRDADLGVEACDDQLLAARRLHDIDDLPVFPGVEGGAIDHFLVGEDIGDLRKDKAATIRDDAGDNGRDAKCFEMRLSAHGVPADDLPRMAEEAHAIRRLLDNNPRDLTRDDILAIYRAAY
jgi:hypothetical protein